MSRKASAGAQPSSPPPRQILTFKPLEAVDWSMRNIAGLSLLSLIVLYGTARPAYDSFYNSLGFTPEDIGLDEKTILFKSALNVVRVAAFVAAVALVSFAVSRMLRARLGARLRWRWADFSAFVAVFVILAVAGILVLEPQDRLAAIAGLVAICIFLSCGATIIWPGRFGPLRAVYLATVLIGFSVLFGFYQNGAQNEAREFMHRGEVQGAYGFVLSITYSEAQPVEIHGDPAHICGPPSQYLVLGRGADYTYVLVIDKKTPNENDRVVRIWRDDYRFNLALKRDPHTCVSGGSASQAP